MTPFQNKLKKLMHEFVKFSYKITEDFPKQEMYSSVSQLRRASLSVVLNYVEGYSRKRPKVKLNFYEMSYGSLGESRYLYYFSLDTNWIKREQYIYAINLAEEIGAMLWSEINSVEKLIQSD